MCGEQRAYPSDVFILSIKYILTVPGSLEPRVVPKQAPGEASVKRGVFAVGQMGFPQWENISRNRFIVKKEIMIIC